MTSLTNRAKELSQKIVLVSGGDSQVIKIALLQFGAEVAQMCKGDSKAPYEVAAELRKAAEGR